MGLEKAYLTFQNSKSATLFGICNSESRYWGFLIPVLTIAEKPTNPLIPVSRIKILLIAGTGLQIPEQHANPEQQRQQRQCYQRYSEFAIRIQILGISNPRNNHS
jgi:hypothetical protein